MFSYCRQVCLLSIPEQHCILTYIMEATRLKLWFFVVENFQSWQVTNYSFTGEGNAFRKALYAYTAQARDPRGEAFTSEGDARKELFFRWVIAGHCSLQVAKPAALEAESADRKTLTCLLAKQVVPKATQGTSAVYRWYKKSWDAGLRCRKQEKWYRWVG